MIPLKYCLISSILQVDIIITKPPAYELIHEFRHHKTLNVQGKISLNLQQYVIKEGIIYFNYNHIGFTICLQWFLPIVHMHIFIKLVPNLLNYAGPINLMQFTVLDWKIESGPDEADYDVVVTIVLKRRIEQQLLSTFLPSLCILILAQVNFQLIMH